MPGGPTQTTNTNEKQKQEAEVNSTQSVDGTTELNSTGSQAGASSGKSTSNPWAPSTPILTELLQQAGIKLDGGFASVTPSEQGALDGIKSTAQGQLNLNPQIEQASSDMLTGANFGQGKEYVTSGYNDASGAYKPVAAGDYLDIYNNPALRGMLDDITGDVTNQVGGVFANAGRSFSGAHSGTLGREITKATAPIMFDQYNRERSNQMDAAKALSDLGVTTSDALDRSGAATVAGQAIAPGMLSSMFAPYQAALSADQRGRDIQTDALGAIRDIALPIASAGGETEQSGTVSTENQQNAITTQDILTKLQSLSKGKSTSSGTSVTEQENDPLSTALGVGIAGLGMLSGGTAGGLGGMLGSQLGKWMLG